MSIIESGREETIGPYLFANKKENYFYSKAKLAALSIAHLGKNLLSQNPLETPSLESEFNASLGTSLAVGGSLIFRTLQEANKFFKPDFEYYSLFSPDDIHDPKVREKLKSELSAAIQEIENSEIFWQVVQQEVSKLFSSKESAEIPSLDEESFQVLVMKAKKELLDELSKGCCAGFTQCVISSAVRKEKLSRDEIIRLDIKEIFKNQILSNLVFKLDVNTPSPETSSQEELPEEIKKASLLDSIIDKTLPGREDFTRVLETQNLNLAKENNFCDLQSTLESKSSSFIGTVKLFGKKKALPFSRDRNSAEREGHIFAIVCDEEKKEYYICDISSPIGGGGFYFFKSKEKLIEGIKENLSMLEEENDYFSLSLMENT